MIERQESLLESSTVCDTFVTDELKQLLLAAAIGLVADFGRVTQVPKREK